MWWGTTLKTPPRLLATVPELATELNAALSTKADGRSVILFGDEASYQTGAQRCEPSCHPPATRARAHSHSRTCTHTNTLTRTHSHTHTQALPHIRREELRPWNARYCVNWCQFLDNCMSIFTQWHLRRMLRRRRKPECTFDRGGGGGGAKGGEEKIVTKRLLGNANEIKWHCVDRHAAPLAPCHANCRQQFFLKTQ